MPTRQNAKNIFLCNYCLINCLIYFINAISTLNQFDYVSKDIKPIANNKILFVDNLNNTMKYRIKGMNVKKRPDNRLPRRPTLTMKKFMFFDCKHTTNYNTAFSDMHVIQQDYHFPLISF